ncbi:MAG: family 10 glycosylhydrolase [Oscillatoriales cyanobacterium C42_A2020_001]|nr:family 10 glycosylhydrolase [Leptolyngbyaceae cyanobacterium C42_A2020_001]
MQLIPFTIQLTYCLPDSMQTSRSWQSRFALLLLPVSSLSSVLLIPPASALSQVKPSDIQGHWAQACLQSLTQQGIFTPYADGSFRPDAAVSRAEYATTMQRAFPQQSQVQKPIQFRDIRNHPNANAIQYIQRTGFWVSEGRDEFKPSQAMTRSQAFGGLANGLRYTAKQSASRDLRAAFKDGRLVPDYLRNAIAAALENRLIINYPDAKRLNPNQSIRRAELAASLCQVNPTLSSSVPLQYVASLGTPVAVTPKPGTNPSEPNKPVVVPTVPVNNPGQPTIPGFPTDPIVTPPRIPTQEIRGAWMTNIDSFVLFNPRMLREAMQDLARLKFNTVYPVAWNWGYTVYPSQVARRVIGHSIDPRYPGLQDRDPLAEVVQQGREKGIAVIPWFEFGFMAPADSELATKYPDWLTQRQDGSKIWMQGEYQRVWLNPLKPEVQQFILDLVDEIVSKYNVDGIQFDDHLGLGVEFGYDPYTIALYKQENGGKEPPKDPKDPAWVKWRADKITEFMGRIHRTVKARKRTAIVALSPNSQKFAYENYLQDWHTWRKRGFVEELILQVYRSDLQSFENELMQPEIQEAKLHIPVGVGVLTGLKNKPVSMSLVQQKIQIARDRGFAGVSFFFYETMWNLSNESADYRKAMFQSIFAPTVTRPNIEAGWTPLN